MLSGTWQRARASIARLANERATPRQIALAVFVGVVVGSTPLYGLQTVMAVALASALRLNRLISVAACSYSIPPVYPFVVFGSVQLGSLLSTGRFIELSFEQLKSMEVTDFGAAWLLGAPVFAMSLGTLLGAAAYALAWWHERRGSRSQTNDL